MRRRSGLLLALTSLAVLVADQVSKAMVRSGLEVGESIPLIDGIISLTHVRNAGAAFGLFPGKLPLFITVSAVVLGGIAWVWWKLKPEGRWITVALGLVAGGAMGNMIDRVVAGRVTDFFDLGWFPVFNVADVSLDVGVLILIVWLMFSPDAFPAESAEEDVVDTTPEASL